MTTYNIAELLSLKDKLVTHSRIVAIYGRRLERETFDELVQAVHDLLSVKVPVRVTFDSLVHLAGLTLSEDLFHDTAWRLAGNRRRLRNYTAVLPWNRQVEDEHVPVQITGVRRAFAGDGKPGADMDFKILAGSPAAMCITKFWTRRYCHFLAKGFGFSKPWGKYPFEDVFQFYGLRLTVLIDCKLSRTEPVFEHILEDKGKLQPQALYDYNRELLRLRSRPQGYFHCPRNYQPSVRCHHCSAGVDQCIAAVHARTYVKQHCKNCGVQDAYFDPESVRVVCVDCYHKSLRFR